MKIFRAYKVWPRFPSISMSGNSCALSCKHCNHTYLNDMKDMTKPDKLLENCLNLNSTNAVGFLLSGGCDKNGEMLNLRKLLPTIKKIKEQTDLIIKLHAGIVDKKLAEDIVSAGVDIASIEVVGSNDTIKEIFDFNATVTDYQNTLINLESAGMPFIVPHICIGLHYGNLKGEFKAIDIIKESCDPSSIVTIVFRPTKGTDMQDCNIPDPDDVGEVISKIKKTFVKKDVSLGCIRPRNMLREEIEIKAFLAGATRMEIPSRKTINYAEKSGYEIRIIEACCALPEELESNAIRRN